MKKIFLTMALLIAAPMAQAEIVQTSKGQVERLPLPNTEIYVTLVNPLSPPKHINVWAAKSTGVGEARFVLVATKPWVLPADCNMTIGQWHILAPNPSTDATLAGNISELVGFATQSKINFNWYYPQQVGGGFCSQ